MIIHDVEQGTPEWFELRLGIPTASRFKDIFTSTGKPAAGADGYMYSLLAELVAGKPLESFESEWMRRGTELEPDARAFYELQKDADIQQVGFITNDDNTIGCSPDGMGLEIKCPAPHTHMKYLLAGKCPSEYYPQVQGTMWLCEYESWDFMSYHPDLPPLIVTVKRDDKYINGLEEAITKFLDKMAKKQQLLEVA
jgi:hypothetical protein